MPGWLKRLLSAPNAFYAWGLGRIFGHRFLQLTHTGRKTGKEYRVVVEVVKYDRTTGDAIVMSGFGRRSGWFRNVSAGTSIFAMVVLERPLAGRHHELDLVTTPAGDPVAMVHCNNGASELAAWAGLFRRFAAASGAPLDDDAVFEVLLREALEGDADAGGLLAYNHLAGEPIAGLTAGRPLFVRTPESTFDLANVMRAQVYGVFGTLALGMTVLHGEGVALDRMYAHGGVFRTAGVAQRFLAAALDAPVAVGDTASEGGAWGIAVLAAFRRAVAARAAEGLGAYLDAVVFADAAAAVVDPDPADVAGFARYLDRYRAGLAVEAAAVTAL